jgi:polyhydroxybutyrate depolymerase
VKRIALVALTLLIASGCRGKATESTATCSASPGESTVKLTHDGHQRSYLLYVPRISSPTPAPVIFDFHGYSSDAAQQLEYSGFRRLADREGVIVVAPRGQGPAASRHFNLVPTPGEDNDVAFSTAVLDDVARRACIDPRRVFAAGMSNGGAMSTALACGVSDRFAAFGAVAAVFYNPLCDRAGPVSIAAFMGTADPIVPFEGGTVRCCGGATIPPAAESMAGWARHDGCSAAATETKPAAHVTLRQWTGCRGAAEVRFYVVEGGGHTWPGAADVALLGPTTHEIDATAILWDFFKSHPRPAG